ncbi:MAG: 3-oxoacyl-[acyl-carrier protein] reductase [Porticoccaceae bacterium]|jgi:3-oxoacyl-[acyl-carrier protein] reductase
MNHKETAVSEFGDLQSLRVVVTGSSSGIGRSIALELAAAGADVVVHCLQSIDQAEKVAAEIRAAGRRSSVIQGDVGDAGKLNQLVDAAWDALGGVDVWVNNAGVDLLTGDKAKLSYEDKLKALLDIDVRSAVLLSKMVGERMVAQGGGTILNIGWDQSDRGMGGDSGELFSAAKNAIMGFTRSLAVSQAPTVRVNCIAPGWIRTAWGEQASDPWQERVLKETPLNRWGTPEDIAKLARFLVSPDASYITGQIINCNGGAVR